MSAIVETVASTMKWRANTLLVEVKALLNCEGIARAIVVTSSSGLLTAIATRVGARFWFDALQQIVRRKAAGHRPAEKLTGTGAANKPRRHFRYPQTSALRLRMVGRGADGGRQW